ncbi:type III effector NopBD [Candidatus Magnetoovum chiemensis]|nr:type III effector NopBD [Candidatus Magnetoovum chiemensis]
MSWERLRRRQLVAIGGLLRHRPFFHRPDWLAGGSVEHEHKALFGALDQHVALAAAGVDPGEGGLRRQVVIPDIMVHGLERPHQLAGFDAQRDDGVGMRVVTGPLAAPEVRTRRRRRQKQESRRVVDRHRRPDIGRARDGSVMIERVPAPANRAGAHVDPMDMAARRVGPAVVGDRGSHHHDAMAHHRRRGDLKFTRPFQRHAGVDPDLAIVAEIDTALSGSGIQRDHTCIVGAHDDAAVARRILRAGLVAPVGDTAAGPPVGGAQAWVDVQVESPLLRTGAGVERNDVVERRACDQAVLDEQRRRFRFGARHKRGRLGLQVAGVEFPGLDQEVDIARPDLVERRESRACRVAAPVLPGCGGGKREQGKGNQPMEPRHDRNAVLWSPGTPV